ncbi:MAG: signal transduction histidine kinase [Alphaproteobacteria bacterium]|jgi:signal transduction histidine kinase
MVRERADRRGLTLDLEIPTLPALYADARRIKQVMINLLSNAVKFTEEGGTITIKAWHNSDSGCVIQVVDTGIGIAVVDIPKALGRFQQVDSDLNRKYQGTGLGLPLAKALVEQHGGSLDLQSRIGVGTTVTVRLPAERVLPPQT